MSEKLDGFKFVKSQWHLIKKTSEGWQAIAIEVLGTSNPDAARLAAHGQVRIDAVEEAYAPFHPFLTPQEAKIHPTVTINCDKLLADTPLVHGFATDDQSVEEFIANYAVALEANVLPWLERYSQEEQVFEGLTDQDPKKWITSDRLIRYPALLAILARRGDWETFDQAANEFLSYCDAPHAQVYKPLAESLASGLREVKA